MRAFEWPRARTSAYLTLMCDWHLHGRKDENKTHMIDYDNCCAQGVSTNRHTIDVHSLCIFLPFASRSLIHLGSICESWALLNANSVQQLEKWSWARNSKPMTNARKIVSDFVCAARKQVQMPAKRRRRWRKNRLNHVDKLSYFSRGRAAFKIGELESHLRREIINGNIRPAFKASK